MNILYFCPGKTLGHLLEYFHHFYDMATEDSSNTYYCVMGDNFEEAKNQLKWRPTTNINIVVVENSDPYDQNHIIRKSIVWGTLLRKSIRQYNIQKVFLPCLAKSMPLLPFYLYGLDVKVSGILYNISYYYPNRKWTRRTRDYIVNFLYSITRKISNVFLLNAEKAVTSFNSQYRTEKFRYLPDPFQEYNDAQIIDIRALYKIPPTDTLFCLFGYMDIGKNLENILEAFSLLPSRIQEKCWLITAGDVHQDFVSCFDDLRQKFMGKFHWISEKRFMPNQYINGLVKGSDFIFMTYHLTGKSSGMFGYASYYSTPVIASSGGMVEEIIRKYNLGFCLDGISAKDIKDFIVNNFEKRIKVSRLYVEDHSLDSFKKMIYQSLC